MVVINFLASYAVFIIPALFGVLLLFAAVNWLSNPYGAQNRKIENCRRKIASYPDAVSKHTSLLPKMYQRQWRAYVNTGAERPSKAFEFVRRKNTLYLLRLLILAAAVLLAYIAVFAVSGGWEYIVCQAVFYVSFAFVMIVNRCIYNRYEKNARKVFARFVAELNKAAAKPCKSIADDFDKTVKEINELNKGDVTKTALNKASEILHSKGLNNNRTVQEQRKLNTALNGLLQSYSRAKDCNV